MEFMKKYLLIIAALLALTSCLDNKLDEDFKKINEVKRWENIEEKYTVYAGEEIVLAPKVVFTIDSINPEMEFEWYVGTELVSTEPTYTFMSNQIATHNVTFCPMIKIGPCILISRLGLPYNLNMKQDGWCCLVRGINQYCQL